MTLLSAWLGGLLTTGVVSRLILGVLGSFRDDRKNPVYASLVTLTLLVFVGGFEYSPDGRPVFWLAFEGLATQVVLWLVLDFTLFRKA